MKRFVIACMIFLLFILLILPKVTETANQKLGNANLPDTRIFYTQDEMYQIAEEIGEEGRSYFVRHRITIDLIWPIVYAWFLYTGIVLVYTSFNQPYLSTGLRWLPVLTLIFDYLENGLASVVMLLYPTQIDSITKWVPIATLLKWVFVSLSIFALISGILIRFIRYSRQRERKKWAKENQE